MGLTSPSKHALWPELCAESGTTARISFALRIRFADIESACLGTGEIFMNHASPICC